MLSTPSPAGSRLSQGDGIKERQGFADWLPLCYFLQMRSLGTAPTGSSLHWAQLFTCLFENVDHGGAYGVSQLNPLIGMGNQMRAHIG